MRETGGRGGEEVSLARGRGEGRENEPSTIGRRREEMVVG